MSEEENEQIENPELAKLAQKVQKSEIEKALSETETEEKEETEEEGKEEKEQVYPFIGSFFDTILRTIAERRGMPEEEIEKHVRLNEIEIDGINKGLSPVLQKIFEKIGLESDEVYAVITFITLIAPRFVIVFMWKPKKEEKKEEMKNDQQKQTS